LAIEIRYVVENTEGLGFPKIYKVVLQDDVESIRVSPDFGDVQANAPEVLSEYYATVKTYIAEQIALLPESEVMSRESLSIVSKIANCFDDIYQLTPRNPSSEG